MESIITCDWTSFEKLENTFLLPLIEKVRLILSNSFNLTFPAEYTGFLVRCLRIKDYDAERAAILIKNFARCILQIPEMLDKFQPKLCRDVYSTGMFTVLNSRDKLGRKVILTRVGNWDLKSYDFDQAATALVLLFIFIVGESPETQRNGVVFVSDLRGLEIRHLLAIKLSRLPHLLRLLQDGAPGRIKRMHFLFHSKVWWMMYQFFKPFLKEKLANRLQFHGNDLTSLHKHVGKEALPESLGGELGEGESIDLRLLEKLMEADGIHKQLKTYGIVTH